jgi:hypothetical protein
MRVNVIEKFRYAVQGIYPTTFEEGAQDIPDDAARYALSDGKAVELDEDDEPVERKAVNGPSENKSRRGRK